jgi:hypothetical protein
MVNHVYQKLNYGWALRATGFVFLTLLIIANTLTKSRLRPIPKKLQIMAFVHPLKEPPFALLTLACFSFAMAVYQPGIFINLDAIKRNMNRDLAGYLLSIMNASR